MDEEKERVTGSIALPKGIDLAAWLDATEDSASSAPSEAYLRYAAVSLPMIQLTQLAHLENLYLQGISPSDLIAWTQGATGHSQGLMSAVFACCQVEEDSDGEKRYAHVSAIYQIYAVLRRQRAKDASLFRGDAGGARAFAKT